MLVNQSTRFSQSEFLPLADALAIVSFAPVPSADEAVVHTGLELLDDSSPEYELLDPGERVIERGQADRLRWSRSKHLMFVSLEIPWLDTRDIEPVTEKAYAELLDFVRRSEYRHLVRFWNYLPAINSGDGDQEVYRRFCNGRLRAFEAARLIAEEFPAASAVGHHRENLTVSLLCSAVQPVHHANPQQVDAYDYPRQYGPSSPSFARGTSLTVGDRRCYFVSGTASILGHQSVHEQDLQQQIKTTQNNILQLIAQSGLSANDIGSLRVYLRNREDLHSCRRFVEEAFPHADAVYLHADICRAELLVEIECICVADKL